MEFFNLTQIVISISRPNEKSFDAVLMLIRLSTQCNIDHIDIYIRFFLVTMPKHDFLTPKAIANRIKSKGLQKLRWFCQMCQKQCRDENGFKCHLMSESHQRQMMLVAENPNKYLDYFSEEFLTDFLELLRRRFGTKRVHNNQVYNEYIQFKEHIHMNSTKWVTLTEFTKWLGREGLCHVDETPKGWFISYIDRDAEAIKKQEALKAKEKMDYTDEERNRKFIERQMALDTAEKKSESVERSQPSELKRNAEKITLSLQNVQEFPSCSKAEMKPFSIQRSNPLNAEVCQKKLQTKSKSKPKSALQEIMEEGLAKKKMKLENGAEVIEDDSINDSDKWLCEGIVVKIITKRLGEKYYKEKCEVIELKSDYVAVVRLINYPEVTIKLDVIHVETVIPKPGNSVKIVKGKLKGRTATLKAIVEDKYCVSLDIDGLVIENVPYENVCKMA